MIYNSVSGKSWIFKKFENSDVKEIAEKYYLSETVAKLISIRKKNIENIDMYLNPTIRNLLPNPLKLIDMNNAVNRTYECIKKNELIGVFGDYDVDGASSTAILAKYFYQINHKINIYIPDRKKEGYGPSIFGFDKLIKKGSKIIFTVDCGTMSFDPIEDAQKKNVDVIVLDHHQSDNNLPNAYAIVNPNRYDEKNNLNYLCAAGVCFMFLVALNQKLRNSKWFEKNKIEEPNILNYLDLVSLGTVCDVVPLIGLNRAIVKQGLKIISKRLNLGLKTLYDICKIDSKPSINDLGYRLGPRINAGGRVGKSSHGAELLSSNDPQKSYQIALDLDRYNKERQSIEFLLFEKVNEAIKKYINDPVLVVVGKNWHEGIIGIIASRIKDKYNKPTVIISSDNDQFKGSARSVHGFDIGSQIIQAKQLGIIEKGGGHKMAGGFVILKDNIDKLREYLINNFKKIKKIQSEKVGIYIDSILAPSAINENFYKEIDHLSPFGAGNTEPMFVIENLKVISSNVVGSNHIKSILCGKDGSIVKTIAFNALNSNLEPYLNKKNKKRFNVAGRIILNQWKGQTNIEFLIDDLSTVN